MDIWDKKKRSAVMAKIRSKDTKPELIVRRYLWSRGYRYRKNVRGLPGTPDIVLRKYGVAIFVHGRMGWSVMTIWECQLKPAVREQTLREVEYWINHAYLERLKPKPAKVYEMVEESPSVAAEGRLGYGKSKPFEFVKQTEE